MFNELALSIIKHSCIKYELFVEKEKGIVSFVLQSHPTRIGGGGVGGWCWSGHPDQPLENYF